MKNHTYRVIIEPDGDEYHGYVPALLGCHTHGASIEEVRVHLRDAISLHLSHLYEKKLAIPEDRGLESFETVSISSAAYA